MPSSYSTNLGLELPATGEKSGIWGDIVNSNLGTLLEQAISGYVAVPITDGADTTITMPDGATGVARNMVLQLTGSLSADRNLIVPAKRKLYFIHNSCAYSVTVKCSGQTGVAVPSGVKLLLVCNGTDVVTATNYVYGDISGNAATVTDGLYSTTPYSDPSWLTALSATKLTGTIASDRLPVVPATKGGTGADNVTTARANLNVPTRTGGDASGTWYINVVGSLSGNASSATTATNVTGIVNVANGGTGSSTGAGFIRYNSGSYYGTGHSVTYSTSSAAVSGVATLGSIHFQHEA